MTATLSVSSAREVKENQSVSVLISKFAGLQPSKITEAVAALLKYVGANNSAEKVLFQEDEMLYLVISADRSCCNVVNMGRCKMQCKVSCS